MEQLELVKIEEVTEDSGAVVMQKSGSVILLKGAKHKYIKRELVSVKPKKYRYWYRNPKGAIVSQSSLHAGAKFRHGKEGEHGHYEVKQVHRDNKGNVTHVEIHHDETDHNTTVTLAQLKDMIHGGEHHLGEPISDKTERLKRDWLQVNKTGTKKQIERMRDTLLHHAQAYPAEMAHFGEEFVRSDPKVAAALDSIEPGSTTMFVTHKGTKKTGPKGDKKTHGGQKVQVELEHAPFGELMKQSLYDLDNMGHKKHVMKKIMEKTGVDEETASQAYDEVHAYLSKDEPMMEAYKKPLTLAGKTVPGVTVYAGKDKSKQGTIYLSGVVTGHKELDPGHGKAPAPKSKPKTLAKQALQNMLPIGSHRQYTMTLEGLASMTVKEPEKPKKKALTDAVVKKGDSLDGSYQDAPFKGDVTSVDADQSGYASQQNWVKVHVKLTEDLMWPETGPMAKPGKVRYKAGEGIVITGIQTGKGIDFSQWEGREVHNVTPGKKTAEAPKKTEPVPTPEPTPPLTPEPAPAEAPSAGTVNVSGVGEVPAIKASDVKPGHILQFAHGNTFTVTKVEKKGDKFHFEAVDDKGNKGSFQRAADSKLGIGKPTGLPTKASELKFEKTQGGGLHGGAVVSHPDHPEKKFFVKATPKPHLAHAEHAGSHLSSQVLGESRAVKAQHIDTSEASSQVKGSGGNHATIQEMMPDAKTLPKSTSGLVDLPPSVRQDVVTSHVANWLVGDHDAHGAQYLFTPDGNGAVRIDFGQSFKHFGDDRLDTDYHPNQKFGESRPAPLKLLDAHARGQVDLNLSDPKIFNAVKRAEKTPDSEIRKQVEPYAKAMEKKTGKSAESTIQAVVDRKRNIRKDFEKFFSDIESKRQGKPVQFKFGKKMKKSAGVLAEEIWQDILRKARAETLAEKVYPNKETVSKPVKPGDEVRHYMHKFKHGEPLSTTGEPPESREQAIAIGLSVKKRGGSGTGGKKKGAKVVSKGGACVLVR